MPDEEKPIDFWDVDCPEHLKEFKYPLSHVISHNPAAKREIILQFTQPMPNAKPLVISRLALSIPHTLELLNNLKTQIEKIRGDQDPPTKRF